MRCLAFMEKLLDGAEVEWKPLGEVCEKIFSGKNRDKHQNGIYPVYGSTGIIGRTDNKLYDEKQILVARVGANAGYVHIGVGAYDVIDAFFTFAQAEQKREAEELIGLEGLNEDDAKRYIITSLRREFASENGTELNAILPKMSPLNPQYLPKKQRVFRKIAAFVEKFKGVGGEV